MNTPTLNQQISRFASELKTNFDKRISSRRFSAIKTEVRIEFMEALSDALITVMGDNVHAATSTASSTTDL